MLDQNALSLLMQFETRQDKNKNNKIYWDFDETAWNRNFINDKLKSANWEVELIINSNEVDLSLKLLLNKVQKLIKFWAPPQKNI